MNDLRHSVKNFAERTGLFGALRDLEQQVHALAGHVHEPDFRAIPRELPPGVIADVGANVGQSVIAFRRLFPERAIHAFEPNPSCQPTLRRVAALVRGNVTVHECGVGEAHSELAFHVPVLESGVEMLQEGSFDPEVFSQTVTLERIGRPFGLRTLMAPVLTLDETGLEIALLKVDVQGLELAVLRGAAGLLERHRPVVLVEREESADSEVEKFLACLGYEGRTLTNNILYLPHSVPAGGSPVARR
jgi:FkbM family methyltransferase